MDPTACHPGSRRTSRRRFLRQGAAAFTVVPASVLGLGGALPPSERLNIAGIGVGGQGAGDLGQMTGENIVALCDVDWAHAAGTFNRFPAAKRYKDFRKMLEEEKGIDAVVVATPDHTHAVASMAAIRLGKHVYCEKPLTHSVFEARQVAEAARARKVATQMGNQGQASEETRRLCEMVWAGAIGPVREAHVWIDRRHRRTRFEFVLSVSLEEADDLSRFTQHDSDNDGLWTSMYGAGECFAWAATRDPEARRRAEQAFEALRFLGTVTQGGAHPAPPGFVARTVLPASGRDPNAGRLEQDRRTKELEDRLWKVIDPRWPLSADGQWYWKCDTSSDELDGHYFFYALYHDLVASGEEKKGRVRKVVQALTDLMAANDFNLIDHDGLPTRWGHFGPRDLNQNRDWWEERGINSLSMLSYLKVAEHMTGDGKYAALSRDLIEKHGYHQNVLFPKNHVGPGSGNQSDDEMAFMSYYNLLRYEKDPKLRQIYAYSFWKYWLLEAPERNPLFNFMFAATCARATWEDAFGARDLSPGGTWLEDAVDALKRYPLDGRNWLLLNSHRLDILPLPGAGRSSRRPNRGHLRGGKVLPIDERFVDQWNHDPWDLDQGGDGRHLASGASFLLPYYMGLYHGFIRE